MNLDGLPSKNLLIAALLLCGGLTSWPAADQKEEVTSPRLPPEFRGARVYRLPDETKPGVEAENPVIYKGLSYQDINFDRLVLNLALSVKPVDRAATIRKIYFQDIRVDEIPVHIETFEEEFKLSKKEVVDLPAPLKCSIVFSDIGSVKPIQQIVQQDEIRITGQSFIEVKLNPLEKLALHTKRLVLPVTLNEEVPLQMFSGNPFLQMAAGKILDALADPTSGAAIALAREHLARVTEDRTLTSRGRQSLYLIYCEFVVRNPRTGTAEKFSQSGTGFVVKPDGKLITVKRVIEPWKFDPQLALLLKREHLEVDAKSYQLAAWAAGATVLAADGQLDFRDALRTENQTLRVLRTASDRLETKDYQDADSGEKSTVTLHAPGENDVALLQLVGSGFQPLTLADPAIKVGSDVKTALFGFPFGLSQAQADPKLLWVKATSQGALITLEHALNPGESGAPLVTSEGKVLALCSGTSECIPLEGVRQLIP